MIVKKLLAPFLNRGGMLTQAENCYIASAAISMDAFDMLMTKLPKKSKVYFVTGLDAPTDPALLRRILKHCNDRVFVRIQTENVFHANVFAFDLAFRKRIAFIGSAQFTMDGLQKNEELSWQTEIDREVEELKVWFERYFESGLELTEKLIDEYEKVFPEIKARVELSAREKRQVLDLVMGRFNWNNVDFTTQMFVKEDFELSIASPTDPGTKSNAMPDELLQKFRSLQYDLKAEMDVLGLYADEAAKDEFNLSIVNENGNTLNGIWLLYGRDIKEIKRYRAAQSVTDFMHFRAGINDKEFRLCLVVGMQGHDNSDREFLRTSLKSPKFRLDFFKAFRHLGREWWIELAGDKRSAFSFKDQDELWAFIKLDDPKKNAFNIGRSYMPDAQEINKVSILQALSIQFQKAMPLYTLMKDKTFERG